MTVSASQFNVAFEALADRTANLDARDVRHVPDVQTFTAANTWTRPANALFVDIVIVAAGGNGASGSTSGGIASGGGGGGAGEVRRLRLSLADCPSSFAISFTSGTPTITGTGMAITPIAGGNGVIGGVGGATNGANSVLGLGAGGAGGTASNAPGVAGVASLGGGLPGAAGAGAAGNNQATPGNSGRGYGAGGGGGGGQSLGGGGANGGGGGAGGYGGAQIANAAGSGLFSANGAQGIVIFTTWRA